MIEKYIKLNEIGDTTYGHNNWAVLLSPYLLDSHSPYPINILNKLYLDFALFLHNLYNLPYGNLQRLSLNSVFLDIWRIWYIINYY